METRDKEKLIDARKSIQRSVNQVIEAAHTLLEPLNNLEDEQKDAVVILGLLIQSIGFAKRPQAKLDEGSLIGFKEAINAVCPPLGDVAISKDPCFEATVSYLSTLKKCQDEGKSEEDCIESRGSGAEAVICVMNKIEEVKHEIGVILEKQEPPKPIPWPIKN